MKKIGIISDTHSHLDENVMAFFSEVDEIWHTGDIGDLAVTNGLQHEKKLRAVYGNIDSYEIRSNFKRYDYFEIEKCKILLIHIAGAFGKYNTETQALIRQYQPNILVCGHSHIVKVAYDEKYNLLYINSGAAGVHGFHQVRTIIRFEISEGKAHKMELIELGSRAKTKV